MIGAKTVIFVCLFYSHITHKITYFGAYYARFCTYFVSKNSGFCYVFYDEK